jgi:transcriptional regulator with XRE-family HTH domain
MNGLKIKQLREQKNYTQDYVADKLGGFPKCLFALGKWANKTIC